MAKFETQLSLAKDLTEHVSQEVRKLGLRVDQGVVLQTPKDTGAATANWLVGIRVPPVQTIGAYAEGASGSTSGQNVSSAINQASGVIAQYPASSLPDLWIVNNLPYIERLNNGSSAQAPAKFVEATIARAVAASG